VVNELRRELGDIQIDLGQANAQEFVEALLDAQPNCLGPAFRQTLARQTGGNALFTVELLRGLQERGNLVQDQAGRWGVGAALNWGRLPDRVEAAIAERVGRLPPAWQALLAVASVEGETFTAELVARVQGIAETDALRLLSGPLSQQHGLVQSQSVIRLADRRLSRYRFRHHLFQKYLYSRLDEAEQSHLHEAVGLTLETLYAGQAEEMDMSFQLARHFEAAGLMAKAVGYLLRAGRQAVRLSANEEAIALFTHGLALLEGLPESPERAEQELELRLALNGPLFAFRGWGSAERAHAAERACRLSRQLEQAGHVSETLYMQADLCRARGEYRASLKLGEQLRELAQRNREPAQILLAHMTLGETQFFRGHLPAARSHFEATIARYDPDQHRALMSLTGLDSGISSRAWLTWSLWILGYPDQALARSREALAMAQELGQPFTSSFVLVFSGCSFSLLRGETEKAGQELDALAQIMAEEEIAFIRAWGMVYQGWWLATQGQVEAAVDQMQAGLVAWQATGAVIVGSTRWPLIELYQQIGQVEVGLTLTDETLAAIDRTGERLFEAELHRLKGALLLKEKVNHRLEAETCFLQAIEISQQQQTKSWELRATMSLARLWQQTGRRGEARQMLADIYNWFTEGFDTPDLQAARMLLEELSLDPE
jgi:predicted ATPase